MSRSSVTLRFRFAWRAAWLTALIVGAVGIASLLFWQGEVESAIEDGVADHLRSLEAELDLAQIDSAELSTPVVLPTPEQFVQVETLSGRVVATSSELAGMGPVLAAEEVLAVAPADYIAERPDPRGVGGEVLVMARLLVVDDAELIGVVGASLDPVRRARSNALWVIAIGVPLVAALVGYGVWLAVTYALKPVNELARRADEVAAGSAPWRLEVEPDTVEMKSLANSLDVLLDHLRESFDSERRFLDDASHELRTPIAVARGELDLLGQEVRADPAMSEAIASAIEELDRLDRLAADLLTLARARGARPATTHCDLAAIARRATGMVIREPDQRKVEVRVRGEAHTAGDENSLERVLVNVVANAVASCETRVDVECRQATDLATITVSDDGPGFPDDMTGSSFPRFTAGRGRGNNGTGLGLAIASAIVEAHGGDLVAENGERGARVVILLPDATQPVAAGRSATRRAVPRSQLR